MSLPPNMLPPSDLIQSKLLHLCESTIAQIRQVLVARHVSIQYYRSGSWQPLSDFIADSIPQSISGDLSDAVGQQLHSAAAVDFKITTKIGPVIITGNCLLLPVFCGIAASSNSQLWGRICIISNTELLQECDRNWLMSIAKLLGMSLSAISSLPHQITLSLKEDQEINSNIQYGECEEADLDLYQQVAALIAQNQLKDEFISKISHDLRAPLMNMRMALKMFKISTSQDLAATAILADKRHGKYLQILESECEREIGLINNVLDLQRLETGNISLELQSIDLVDWLPTVVETFQYRVKQQNIRLDLRLPKVSAHLLTDEGSLQRIMSELLHNACKYTAEHQGIYCELDYPKVKNQPLYLLVGNQAEISMTDLPYIFDRFYRVPSADRQKQGGTGLGLSLVRSLVEQLHGQITVQSSNGWTTFTVALPLAPPHAVD
jgi:signal transduction histidine kinase